MQGATVVALTSGANMNFDRLRLVASLANYGQRTEAMLTLSLPEQPGEFRRFVESVHKCSPGNPDELVVTECKYRYTVDRPAKMLFSLAARSPEAVTAAVEQLRGEGYACRDVTGVSAAQLHLRHMVGGRPRSYTGSIENEKMVVVRRPAALPAPLLVSPTVSLPPHASCSFCVSARAAGYCLRCMCAVATCAAAQPSEQVTATRAGPGSRSVLSESQLVRCGAATGSAQVCTLGSATVSQQALWRGGQLSVEPAGPGG